MDWTELEVQNPRVLAGNFNCVEVFCSEIRNRNTFGSGPIDGWAIKSRSNSAVILAAIAIDGVSIIADITDSECIITYAITATGSRIIYGMGNASAGLIGQFFE